ncbi:MAG: DUF4244 domain-containing protein [Propionibacteriaceae bacterium]|nr:DUF4244 domain-containing protein [Propionibacteriaceae bacterium]
MMMLKKVPRGRIRACSRGQGEVGAVTAEHAVLTAAVVGAGAVLLRVIGGPTVPLKILVILRAWFDALMNGL